MKIFPVMISIVFLAGCNGKTGLQGPQGPKGDKGDPGETLPKSPLSRFWTKSETVDGNGSGLDADTLDGVEYAAIDTAIQAAQTKADANETNITTINSTLDTQLYAFDGEGRVLGRLMSVNADSIVFFHEGLGIGVEAYTNTDKNEADIRGLQDFWMYYTELDCASAQRILKKYVSSNLGLLDNSTGEIRIYQGGGACSNLNMKSKKNLITGECINGDVTDDFCAFSDRVTLDPFTAGVTYGPKS